MTQIFDQNDDELIEAYANLLQRKGNASDAEVLEIIHGKLILISQELQLRNFIQDEALNWHPGKKSKRPSDGKG